MSYSIIPKNAIVDNVTLEINSRGELQIKEKAIKILNISKDLKALIINSNYNTKRFY